MADITTLQPQQTAPTSPDDYGKPDPVRIGGVTVQAVDRITNIAASSLRDAAKDVRELADVVARELESLAVAAEDEGKRSHELVETFVNRVSSIYATAVGVSSVMRGETPIPAPSTSGAPDERINQVVSNIGKLMLETPQSPSKPKKAKVVAATTDEPPTAA